MANSKNKKKGSGASFAGIPRIVMESSDFINLSYKSKVLLFEAAYQFKGKNNGDITFAWSIMSKRGFKSQDTLNKAIHELIDANMILRTREGYFQKPNNRCALYAVTWQAIDDCYGKDLEIAPTTTPPRKFSMEHLIKNHPLRKPKPIDTKSVSAGNV